MTFRIFGANFQQVFLKLPIKFGLIVIDGTYIFFHFMTSLNDSKISTRFLSHFKHPKLENFFVVTPSVSKSIPLVIQVYLLNNCCDSNFVSNIKISVDVDCPNSEF